MSNRRFEMHQYRQVSIRMRVGESDRQMNACGLMGRRTMAKLRKKEARLAWLEPDKELVAYSVRLALSLSLLEGSIEKLCSIESRAI